MATASSSIPPEQGQMVSVRVIAIVQMVEAVRPKLQRQKVKGWFEE